MNWADIGVLALILIIVGGICYNLFKHKQQKSSAVCAGCAHPVNAQGDAVSLKEALKAQMRR
jgi:hypothetical protein